MKGNSLSFAPPSAREGKFVAKIDLEEAKSLNDMWSNAIVMYVVDQSPSLESVNRFICPG